MREGQQGPPLELSDKPGDSQNLTGAPLFHAQTISRSNFLHFSGLFGLIPAFSLVKKGKSDLAVIYFVCMATAVNPPGTIGYEGQ